MFNTTLKKKDGCIHVRYGCPVCGKYLLAFYYHTTCSSLHGACTPGSESTPIRILHLNKVKVELTDEPHTI